MSNALFLLFAYIFCRKEVETMAVVYATLIVKGKKTLEQVPARLKAEVEDLLTALETVSYTHLTLPTKRIV